MIAHDPAPGRSSKCVSDVVCSNGKSVMATQSPLNTYVERLVQVGRVFELYPDRVVVSATWWWGRPYVNTVRLASLSPDYGYQIIRYRLFKHGILAMAIGVALALLLGRSDGTLFHQAALVSGWGIAAVGLAIAAMTYQRVLFARFPPRAGRGGLDIARSGPDRERFEEFVKLVQRQIRRQTKP
jgi:hypothetical protein